MDTAGTIIGNLNLKKTHKKQTQRTSAMELKSLFTIYTTF